ncbi:hypothetical protein AMECASPLE_028227, partial [Ameca splendens]
LRMTEKMRLRPAPRTSSRRVLQVSRHRSCSTMYSSIKASCFHDMRGRLVNHLPSYWSISAGSSETEHDAPFCRDLQCKRKQQIESESISSVSCGTEGVVFCSGHFTVN